VGAQVTSFPNSEWTRKRLQRWAAETRALLQCLPDEIADFSVSDLQSLIATRADRAQRSDGAPSTSSEFTAPENVPVHIYTLGRFAIEIEGRDAEATNRLPKRPRQLLMAVIAHGGSKIAEEQLCEALWPDADGATAAQSLNVTLHRLRKFLGIHDAIECRGGLISLDPTYCWVDMWTFQRTVDESTARARRSAAPVDEDIEHLDQVFGLYDGPFLPDESAAWALPMRQRLHRKFIRSVLSHAAQYEHMGGHDAAALVYERALEIDPQAEELYHRLMACHAALGRPGEALSVYNRCRQMLRDCLQIEPGPELDRLHAAVKKQLKDDGVFDRDAEPPPRRSAPLRAGGSVSDL
jgi:DNA-binding SARP family transcriptional activator